MYDADYDANIRNMMQTKYTRVKRTFNNRFRFNLNNHYSLI